MLKLLEGVRIIEAGHILLGPLATQMLGDLGADVIKIESLDGDTYRGLGHARIRGGMTAQWMANNRNKRSVSIDLKDPEAKAAVLELVKGADAFVHNMRPAALARLGLDYDALRAIRPQLVYAQATGFGSSGPYAGRPAVDDIVQGWGGVASLVSLHWDEPAMIPMAVNDLLCGLTLANTVQAGLLRARATGRGCFIETPMFETVATAVMNQHLNGHAFRDDPASEAAGYGYARMMSPHRKPVATADGHIIHTLYNFRHWTDFFTEIGRQDLLDGPMMVDRYAAAAHVQDLYRILAEEILPTRTTAEWLEVLGRLDIPCAPVLGVADLSDDPHLQAVGLFRDYEHPSQGPARDLRLPLESRDIETGPDRHPPELGEHTLDVLRELGIDEAKIKEMAARGVLKSFERDPAAAAE